jgi:hypothetical protein
VDKYVVPAQASAIRVPSSHSKMFSDKYARPAIKGVEANFDRLADIDTLLSLAAMIPQLESVKNLVVFAQSPSVYVCDFTRALNLCSQDIHDAYKNPSTTFRSDAFDIFTSISNLNHDHIKLRWQPDLNNNVEHLVFTTHHDTTAGSHLNTTCFDPTTRKHRFVTRELWEVVKTTVKQNVEGKYIMLILNLMLGLVLNLLASLPIFSLGLLISMDSTACFGVFMLCIRDFWLALNQLLIFYLEPVCFGFGICGLHGTGSLC